MSLKRFIRFGFLLVLVSLAFGISNARADSSVIGPYTEILIPFEDLPVLNEALVYNPEIRLEPYEAYDAVLIQVLSVLDDPREVPLARFAHNSANGDLDKVAGYDLKTINVYIHSQFIVDSPKPDPLLAPDPAGNNPDWPAINLYVEALVDDPGGITQFPCAKMEYADGTEPYQLPVGIDGGLAVGKDGLYNPEAYAPPKPWYYSEDPMVEQGEIREGWVSCLAPDVPLEQLEINARYSHISEPEIIIVNEHMLGFSGYIADASELEIIGLTPADLPANLEECAQMEYCLPQDLISLDYCKGAAKDAGLEKGLCSFYSKINSDGDFVDFTSRVFYTNIQEKPTHYSYPVWSFAGSNLFTDNAIRLEDVPLSFLHDEHGVKTTHGSVVFFDPRIDFTAGEDIHASAAVYNAEEDTWELVPFDPGEPSDEYTFISRVKVAPYGMDEDGLEGYQLIEIGAMVNVLIEQDSIIQRGSANYISPSIGYNQPDNLFEWTVSADLELRDILDDATIFQQENGVFQPGTALINLYPNYDHTSFQERMVYPVKIVTLHNPNLVAKTNMCDLVDCVDYYDEDDTSRDVTKPPRSIPVICAGEWANNIIVDDMQVIKFMEYIREPWGDGRDGGTLHWDDIKYGGAAPVFLYDLRIMGGATPWWIKTIMSSNSRSYDPLGYIYGHTVDLNTGWPVHNDAAVIPYYAVIENDLSKGFLARGTSYPVNFYSEKSGWMGEIIDQKVLAFSSVNVFDDGEDYMRLNEENTGFLLLDEGPMWVTSCQREPVPALSTQALYSPKEFTPLSETEGSRHAMTSLLPGMTYPPYLPVVDGKIYSMGEFGDIYTFESSDAISHYKFTVNDVEIVHGKSDRSAVYVPTEDKFYPAERFPSWNNELFFANNGAFVIPPDTTYVEIKVGVDYLEISEGFHCGIEDEDLQLVYPGYLPINGVIETKPDEPKICKKDDSSFRMAFLFPSLDFELENMLFSIRGGAQLPWNFWRLAE